jgi:N-acetylmuramoyl-L-alanine amidase
MIHRFPKIIVSFLIGISILFQFHPAWASKITDIRIWSAPDHTRVVLDLTQPVQYESASQETPPQFKLELKGSLQTPKREIVVNDPFLTKVILTGQGRDKVKISFTRKPLNADVFLLCPIKTNHRLVMIR